MTAGVIAEAAARHHIAGLVAARVIQTIEPDRARRNRSIAIGAWLTDANPLDVFDGERYLVKATARALRVRANAVENLFRGPWRGTTATRLPFETALGAASPPSVFPIYELRPEERPRAPAVALCNPLTRRLPAVAHEPIRDDETPDPVADLERVVRVSSLGSHSSKYL